MAPQAGSAWLGFAISLEALERRSDAAEAYRRAAASGTLGAEAREYAEQRARSLR
jgi:MSHA biogenesis protein MshN